MKRYHYSKTIIYAGLIVFLFAVLGCPFMLIIELTDYQPSGLLTIIIASMGIICSIYLLYWFVSIWISLDENIVIVHVGGKKYEHVWNDFVDCGVTVNRVRCFGKDKAMKMIYLSTKKLTSVERFKINQVIRKRWSEFIYFEYEKQLFDEILSNLPQPLQSELRQIEQKLLAEYPE